MLFAETAVGLPRRTGRAASLEAEIEPAKGSGAFYTNPSSRDHFPSTSSCAQAICSY